MRIAIIALLAACYTNIPANRDVQASWRGRQRAEIEDRWGAPAAQRSDVMVWSYRTLHVELPSLDVSVKERTVATGARVDAGNAAGMVSVQASAPSISAGVQAGEIVREHHEAAALLDPAGRIADVQGEALHWGPPNDVNLHWGTIFGAHVGMGRLANTPTPLPSGGAYLGGMLNPTLGLVGTFSMVAGTSDMGGAIGLASGLAAQYWPVNRLWLRAGPALLLAFDPGFVNARLKPGVTLGASYAAIKVGTFAVDARFDLSAGPSTTFGTLGIGVNLN